MGCAVCCFVNICEFICWLVGGLRRVCIVEKLYKILIISSYKILKFHGILCHWVQEYLTLSCLDCWWILRNLCVVAWYSHLLHEHLTTLCWYCWWVFSWFCRVAWYSHCLHKYLTNSCLDCSWVLRLPCNVARYSHWLQEYLKPSCLDCWCFLRWSYHVSLRSHRLQKYCSNVIFVTNTSLWMNP